MNVIAQQVVAVTRAPMPWFLEAALMVVLILASLTMLAGATGMALMEYREWREYMDKRAAKK